MIYHLTVGSIVIAISVAIQAEMFNLLSRRFEAVTLLSRRHFHRFANTVAIIADRLGIARCHITRHEVTKAGILAFEVIVALVLRNMLRAARIAFLFRHPNAAVIAQTLAHQRQLGLVMARHRNTGRVNLRKAWIGKISAFFMAAPRCGRIRIFGIGRQIINISIATGGQHDSVPNV